MAKQGFIFYESFREAIKMVPKTQQTKLVFAIIRFNFDENRPSFEQFSTQGKMIWKLILPQIEANMRKYTNGCLPKTKSKPEANDKQIGSKPEAKEKEKEKEKEKTENGLEDFVLAWNKIETIQGAKGLPKTMKINDDLKAIWNKLSKEYSFEEIKTAARKYCKEIESRRDDGKGYIDHRFTLFEFLKQKNGLQKFFNS